MSLQDKDVNQKLFQEFMAFMDAYFHGEGEDHHADGRKADSKFIPGGRYGCAQYVKACGTPALTALSLGQLAQFIQYAINKDLLRYQRTLIVLAV
jgi:hypothetical protein